MTDNPALPGKIVWGVGLRSRADVSQHRRVFRPEATERTDHVHIKDELRDGYRLERLAGPPVQHMWSDSYRVLLQKHRRYLREEGRSRYERGEVFTLYGMARGIAGALYASLVKKPAWRDGWRGLALTVIFLDYVAGTWWSLRRWEWHIWNTGDPYTAYQRIPRR